MLDYRHLAVACYFDSASTAEIEAFIQSVVEGDREYDSCLFEAYSKDVRIARAKMFEFIHVSFPDFSIDSEEGIKSCEAELKRQVGLLLSREIKPVCFCQFFNSLESALVVDRDLPPEKVSFLGDLYNACDWCDDSWTLESAPYLAEEAARVASKTEKAEQDEDTNPPPLRS